MYKGKRYNVLMICLLLIISMVIGLSAGLSDSALSTDPSDSEVVENLPEIDTTIPVEIPAGLKKPGAEATARERLEFALSTLNEGAGYISNSYSAVTVLGNTQEIYQKNYRGGGIDLSERWLRLEGLLSAVGRNEFHLIYSNGVDMLRKTIKSSSSYNYAQKTYNASTAGTLEEFSESYYTTVLGCPHLNDFNFSSLDKDHFSIETYDSKARGKDYYTIIGKINIENLDESYINNFKSNGVKEIKYDYISMEIRIDKETGFFKYIRKVDILAATYGDLTGDVESVTIENFVYVNVSAESVIKNILKNNKLI